MLKPVKMQKVRIIALRSILSGIIRKLHELGIIEIRVSNYEGLEGGSPLDYFHDVSEQLVRVRAIKNILTGREKTSENIPNALEEAKKIKLDEELKALSDEQARLENELIRLEEEQRLIQKLNGFSDLDFSKLETTTITYTTGLVSGGSERLTSIKEKLDSALKLYNIRFVQSGSDTLFLIVHQKSWKPEDALSGFGFNRFTLPSYVTTPSKSQGIVSHEINIREKRLEHIKSEFGNLSHKHYPRIAAIEHALSIEADRAEIASRFNFTATTAIITGWIKSDDLKSLEHEIERFDGQAIVEALSSGHSDIPPVVLSNPKPAGPIQFITESYSLPGYYELDPTMVYLFTIPLLYGMIVGDVLYGVISIFISLFIMKKFASSRVMSNVARVWFYSALPAILFGIVFDEWAGLSHYHLLEILEKWGIVDIASFGISGPLYAGLSRLHQLPMLIGITAIVGLLHLGLGFILGAINEWHHNRKHAAAKIAWLGVEIGGTLVVGAMLLNLLPAGLGSMGLGLLVVSVAGLVFTEGIFGILELPGLVGNVLSYARIAAIGVVGVVLAEIINEFLIPLPQQGLLAFLFFPLFVIMHAVNTFIAMFESLIQGGRLNIIEFKLKFLKGGGKPFEPFAVHV